MLLTFKSLDHLYFALEAMLKGLDNNIFFAVNETRFEVAKAEGDMYANVYRESEQHSGFYTWISDVNGSGCSRGLWFEVKRACENDQFQLRLYNTLPKS